MSPGAIQVVFNADDFGLAPEANAAVAQLCRAGVVRSTSLLVTGPAAEEAMALARGLPALSVGLHLAWVHERAAGGADAAPDFVDDEGLLPLGYREFMVKWIDVSRVGGAPVEQARHEATAQIKAMIAAGLHPTHLDSHQHLHLWPPLFELAVELCEAFRIPFIRFPGQGALHTGHLRVSWLRRWLMRGVIGRAHRWHRAAASEGGIPAGVRHADEVWGMLAAGHLDEALLVDILERLTPGRHEIMCHPAAGPCDSYTRHSWGYEWAAETAALGSAAVHEAMARRGLDVTNYRELASGRS